MIAMNLAATNLNRRLAEMLQRRADSENFQIAQRVGFWRLIGIGLVVFGLGAALGAAFYGYSFIRRDGEDMDALASRLSQLLSDTHLHATADGTVQLEPHQIGLAKGATVSINENSRLHLDPQATVLANGTVTVQVPSMPVPRVTQARAGASASPIFNFTVFKRVSFEKGAVLTGWKFLTSVQKTPTSQYCYYTENAETPDIGVSIDIAKDGKLDSTAPPKNFDMAAAFARCVWFQERGHD
jgi:hypothetical protein